MWLVGSLWLLAGCTREAACPDGDSCSSDSDGAVSEDTAAMVYSSEDPEPLWTAEQVGEQIQAMMAYGIPNGLDVGLNFFDLMSKGNSVCPGADVTTLSTIPEGCDTDDGYHYAGIGWFIEAIGVEGHGEGLITSWGHGGDFEILYPDGSAFSGGGGMTDLTEFNDDGSFTFFGEVHGSWTDESRTDWLGQGYSSVISWDGGGLGTDGSYWLTLLGGLGVGGIDLHFEDVSWDTESTCAGKMTGKLHLRDSRGYWYVWDLGDDCDDCGSVTFHSSVDVGELCLDMTDYGYASYLKMAPR